MRERPSIGGSKSRGGTKDAGTCDAAQRGDQLVTRPLLIEQPELHLHPAWQADITSMLLDVWPTGNLDVDESPESKAEVQGIVETHSETMVLRVARLIRNGQLAAARPGERREFQILAVGQAPNKPGTTEVRAVNIDEDGWFDRQQFFEGFFADRVDEELG
jgi:predicted ATPase